MTYPLATGAPGADGARSLQRVVVHVALRSRGQLLTDPTGAAPWALLAHGESPAAGAVRALAAVEAPPARTGGPVAVTDAVRRTRVDAADGPRELELHTVHVVLSAEVTDHARRDEPRPARWVPDTGVVPQVADELVDVDGDELRRLAPVVDGEPVLRQRLAAYAVVTDGGRILLTRLSVRTPSPGRWTLPGGGVDHGEHPLTAVVREVREETGMVAAVDALVDFGSEHFTGRSPRGVLEDFHALRLLVTATVPHVREPEVLDVGGSTDVARWVPLEEAADCGLVGVAHRGVQVARRRLG